MSNLSILQLNFPPIFRHWCAEHAQPLIQWKRKHPSQFHWSEALTCVLAPALMPIMKPNIFAAGFVHVAVDLVSCFCSGLTYE